MNTLQMNTQQLAKLDGDLDELQREVDALRSIPALILADGSPQPRGTFEALRPADLAALVRTIHASLNTRLAGARRHLDDRILVIRRLAGGRTPRNQPVFSPKRPRSRKKAVGSR
jgi:hypothetical protein